MPLQQRGATRWGRERQHHGEGNAFATVATKGFLLLLLTDDQTDLVLKLTLRLDTQQDRVVLSVDAFGDLAPVLVGDLPVRIGDMLLGSEVAIQPFHGRLLSPCSFGSLRKGGCRGGPCFHPLISHLAMQGFVGVHPRQVLAGEGVRGGSRNYRLRFGHCLLPLLGCSFLGDDGLVLAREHFPPDLYLPMVVYFPAILVGVPH